MKEKLEIIAEIGKNFCITKKPEPIEVLLERAKTLIIEAKKAGASVVKFQCHFVDDEIHPKAKITSPHFDQDRHEWVKRNTYPFSFWLELKTYCETLGMEFLATPMSKGAAILLEHLGVKRWKIGSGDILDFVMLDYIRNTGKPIIISSGMSSIQELRLAYNYLAEKVKDITILHCVSNYPCKLEDLNLNTIKYLKKEFPKAKIGFSDHSLEVSTGAMVVSLGAVVVEKHFTLDRDSFGPDHKVSLLPHEFKQMVKEIKDCAVPIPKEALGVATKFINESEMKFRPIFRKGLFASNDIPEGKILEPEDFYALRPKGEALKSELYPALLGSLATKSYQQYEAIK
jgi:N,N'-diacetyllegionaminate synthase